MKSSAALRIGIIAVLAVLVIGVALVFPVREWLEASLTWIENLGPLGPVLLAVFYVFACVLFLPGSVLTLAAGFAFGFLWGYVAVTIGSVVGATCAFLLGRYLARKWVENHIANNDRFESLDKAVRNQGFKIVLLTRLSPVFPFNALNYAFGLTDVSLRDYVLGSFLGMIPGTVMYVYLGTGLKSLAEVISGEVEGGRFEQVVFGIGLVATIAVTVLITRMAKRALSATTDEPLTESSADSPSGQE